MNTHYLRCRVSRGMFDSEFYVMIGDSAAAYVDERNVRVKSRPKEHAAEVDGEVLVYLVAQRDNEALVELPGEPVVGSPRTWVSKQLLTAG